MKDFWVKMVKNSLLVTPGTVPLHLTPGVPESHQTNFRLLVVRGFTLWKQNIITYCLYVICCFGHINATLVIPVWIVLLTLSLLLRCCPTLHFVLQLWRAIEVKPSQNTILNVVILFSGLLYLIYCRHRVGVTLHKSCHSTSLEASWNQRLQTHKTHKKDLKREIS